MALSEWNITAFIDVIMSVLVHNDHAVVAVNSSSEGVGMKSRIVALALLVALALSLVGCAGAAPSPMRQASSGADTGQAASAPSGMAPAAPPVPAEGSSGGAAQEAWDRYVIRNADLRLVVKDVEAASAEVEKVATEAGGYVAQSNTRREDSRVLADISIQVPAESFDRVVEQLRRLAVTVDYAKTSTQDVTEEYVDNEARLRNLRAAEESTQRLLDKTTKMEDILAVRRELTSLRGEIEKIEGRQNYLKRRVEMSTINVHLTTEASTALAAGRSGWDPLANAQVAWESSLSFISRAVDVLVVLIVFLWWVFPLAGIVWGVWRWRRRRRQPKPATVVEPPSDRTPQGQGAT